jgi:ABC-type nitrate/sulfonate/bicarbonate transport system substrate-binding protein
MTTAVPGGAVSRRGLLRAGAAATAAAALTPALGSCLMMRQGAGGDNAIRFAFAPEALWDYMLREGTVARYESTHGFKIQTASTWDEFAYFAGGHGDIVSTATYELPLLEKQTGIKTVTFGKYNLLRITPVVRADSPYRTLADIPKGSRIAVPSAVASTLLWGMFARKLHNLEFRVGRGDYRLVVEDHLVMPEHLDRGEVEAALVIPEAAIPQLRRGRFRVLYDNRLPYELYGGICGCRHHGVMGNMFTATESWFEEHRDQAAAFLALWEEGIRLWRRDQAEIIETFPQHFSVEESADIKAMQDYIARHDWFVDSVYLDQAWIDREKRLYTLMKETGFMSKDAPTPRFEALPRPAA